MKLEEDETWLRDRMQELRQRAAGSEPSFQSIWRRALTQRASRLGSTWQGWSLVGASTAALLVLLAVFAHGERTARMEREYVEMEGVLMSYWQAPSDTLLPADEGDGLDEP